jgi:hypothetical protein
MNGGDGLCIGSKCGGTQDGGSAVPQQLFQFVP